MPLLILPPRYSSDSISLWRAAVASGWEVERLQTWNPPHAWRDRQPVIYGELHFALTVAEVLDLALLEPSFDWLAELPYAYRQRHVRSVSLGEIGDVAEPAFIKPADDKCFEAGVYPSGAALLASLDLPETIPVLVSEPVVWESEFRCFIRDGKVAAISPYFRDGELAQADDETWPASVAEIEEASRFCEAVLEDPAVSVPPALVLDVGMIAGKGWSVVEANPAWSSGIYGCVPSAVLSVLQCACRRQDELTDNDRLWALSR